MSYYYAYYTMLDGNRPENVGIYSNNYDGSYYYSKVAGFYLEISATAGYIYETSVQSSFYNSNYGAYEMYAGSYPSYGSRYITYSPQYGIGTKLIIDAPVGEYNVKYTSYNSYFESKYHSFSYYYAAQDFSSYETGFHYYSPASGYYKGPYSNSMSPYSSG